MPSPLRKSQLINDVFVFNLPLANIKRYYNILYRHFFSFAFARGDGAVAAAGNTCENVS